MYSRTQRSLPPNGQPIWDKQSGYAVNIPATEQLPPKWWLTYTDAWERILAKRAELGIVIDDGFDAETESFETNGLDI